MFCVLTERLFRFLRRIMLCCPVRLLLFSITKQASSITIYLPSARTCQPSNLHFASPTNQTTPYNPAASHHTPRGPQHQPILPDVILFSHVTASRSFTPSFFRILCLPHQLKDGSAPQPTSRRKIGPPACAPACIEIANFSCGSQPHFYLLPSLDVDSLVRSPLAIPRAIVL